MPHNILSRIAVVCLFLLLSASGAVAASGAVNPVKQGQPMQPPRVLVQKMFPQDPLHLSLSGGWGYEQSDPLVITTPREMEGQYFDTEPLEFAMVDFRNFEEFSGARPDAQKMVAMGFERGDQRIVRENGRVLECITGHARVIPLADFMKLSADVETIDPKDAQARRALEGRITRMPRVYWFDITEPFAHNAELEKKGVTPPKGLRR